MKFLVKCGLLSTGVEHSSRFNCSKAVWQLSVQFTQLGAFFLVRSVKGAANSAYFGMNVDKIQSAPGKLGPVSWSGELQRILLPLSCWLQL